MTSFNTDDNAEYDATVAVLGACIVLHMNEEEDKVFPMGRVAGLDTAALGRQMAQRQKTLNDDAARIGARYSTAGAVTWPVVSCVLMA